MLNPRAYSELAPLGKPIGLLFLFLAAALAIAGTGWLKRRRWGWAVGRGHHRNAGSGRHHEYFLRAHIYQGLVGVAIAGALLFYMTRPLIRARFVPIPKQIVHSHDP